jgi:hypothetical protein
VDEALSELQASRAALVSVAQDLDRDRTERKRSNKLARSAAVFAAILAVVDLAALGGVIVISRQNQDVIKVVRDQQQQGAARGKRIEQSTEETHLTAVRLDCAFSLQSATPDTSPAGRQASIDAFNECVKNDGPAKP